MMVRRCGRRCRLYARDGGCGGAALRQCVRLVCVPVGAAAAAETGRRGCDGGGFVGVGGADADGVRSRGRTAGVHCGEGQREGGERGEEEERGDEEERERTRCG